jgi:hypothetical protein
MLIPLADSTSALAGAESLDAMTASTAALLRREEARPRRMVSTRGSVRRRGVMASVLPQVSPVRSACCRTRGNAGSLPPASYRAAGPTPHVLPLQQLHRLARAPSPCVPWLPGPAQMTGTFSPRLPHTGTCTAAPVPGSRRHRPPGSTAATPGRASDSREGDPPAARALRCCRARESSRRWPRHRPGPACGLSSATRSATSRSSGNGAREVGVDLDKGRLVSGF